jgi:hypothetical protein
VVLAVICLMERFTILHKRDLKNKNRRPRFARILTRFQGSERFAQGSGFQERELGETTTRNPTST